METFGITIREAALADVEAIIDALVPVAAEDRWIATEAPIDRSRLRALFEGRIGVPDGTIFVAVDATRLVGSLGVRRGFGMSLQVHPWNEAALALYEKSGFVREGYLHKHVRRRNGELWDVIQMGLLFDDAG